METRRTERDSESGVDKIAVGHHIRERGHVIERKRNNRTGEMNENKDYINIDEGKDDIKFSSFKFYQCVVECAACLCRACMPPPALFPLPYPYYILHN